jgi:hypothetical protein
VIRKQLDWVVEAAHRIFADAFEIEIAFDEVGEGAGQQQCSTQLFGEVSRRKAMLTAGPMTVMSSRVRDPLLPYMTSPTWTPMP